MPDNSANNTKTIWSYNKSDKMLNKLWTHGLGRVFSFVAC